MPGCKKPFTSLTTPAHDGIRGMQTECQKATVTRFAIYAPAPHHHSRIFDTTIRGMQTLCQKTTGTSFAIYAPAPHHHSRIFDTTIRGMQTLCQKATGTSFAIYAPAPLILLSAFFDLHPHPTTLFEVTKRTPKPRRTEIKIERLAPNLHPMGSRLDFFAISALGGDTPPSPPSEPRLHTEMQVKPLSTILNQPAGLFFTKRGEKHPPFFYPPFVLRQNGRPSPPWRAGGKYFILLRAGTKILWAPPRTSHKIFLLAKQAAALTWRIRQRHL